MQVTLDIPEPLYRELQSQAREDHTSLEDVLLKRADRSRPQPNTTVPHSNGGTGVLIRMGINLNDVAFMEDDEWDSLEQALQVDPEAAIKDFGLRRLNDPA